MKGIADVLEKLSQEGLLNELEDQLIETEKEIQLRLETEMAPKIHIAQGEIKALRNVLARAEEILAEHERQE